LGGAGLLLLVEAAALLGLREFSELSRRCGAHPWPVVPFLALALLIIFAQAVPQVLLGVTVATPILLALLLSRRGLRPWLRDTLHTTAGPCYLGLLALALPLRAMEHGLWWVLLGLGAVVASDTAAYFTGRALGRHRLAPAISAGKTWEGAAGGLIAAVLVTVGMAILSPLALRLWQSLLLAIVVGALSQLGDLVESALKRAAQVKDAGGLLPGHGGMLDRLDSIVFPLAAIYYGALGMSS